MASEAASQTAPSPQLAEMLIDTGASHTSLDKDLIAALGLTPTGSVPLLTPSTGPTPVVAPTYDVGLVVLHGHNESQHVVPVQQVTECDFSAQGIGGLLGRDFLALGRLTYSGPNDFCYLSF